MTRTSNHTKERGTDLQPFTTCASDMALTVALCTLFLPVVTGFGAMSCSTTAFAHVDCLGGGCGGSQRRRHKRLCTRHRGRGTRHHLRVYNSRSPRLTRHRPGNVGCWFKKHSSTSEDERIRIFIYPFLLYFHRSWEGKSVTQLRCFQSSPR